MGLLGGCSAFKLGYGQGPSLAHWWLDGYVDFDASQSQRVKGELQRWFAWHQQSQLQTYAAHLAQTRGETAQAVTGERLCRLSEATRDLLVPAVERVLPTAAEVVLTLTPAQLDRLDARYKDRTADLRAEVLQSDSQERHQAAVRRASKRYEDFYGKLSNEQRQMIDAAQRSMPVDAAASLERRHKRHEQMMTELRAIVREQPSQAQVQERLRVLVRRFDGRAPVEPVAQAKALAAANCELAARVHNSSSPQQRQFLAEKLKGWEDDLRALAAEPAALAGARAASLVAAQ